jgi:hypothetical protein
MTMGMIFFTGVEAPFFCNLLGCHVSSWAFGMEGMKDRGTGVSCLSFHGAFLEQKGGIWAFIEGRSL